MHHQCKKGVGVDCVHLLVGVATELGFKTPEVIPYRRTPPLEEFFYQLGRNLTEIPREALLPGDVLALKPNHVAILTGHDRIIHAKLMTRSKGRVVEEQVYWPDFLRAYRFPEVGDG